MNEDIMVSIVCATYNHVNYIRQCLDSFLMQKTNFAYEILIHDDASTDGTTDIIEEYEKEYPNIIKPIYQTENQYSKGISPTMIYNLPRAKGKYIAMCEGDDYWTDPLKLQKQVDFLENHLEYSVCGHCFQSYIESESKLLDYDTGIYGTYTLEDLISRNVFCSTLSVVFRKESLDLKRVSRCRRSLDIILAYMLLKAGKGFCMNDVMAVYRIHSMGVWSGSDSNKHIYENLDVRMAIYEIERTPEAVMFLMRFIQNLGRKWMVRNFGMMRTSLLYVHEQLGFSQSLRFCVKLLMKK